MAINDTVRIAFDSYITEFTLDMKQLVDNVKEKVDLHLREVTTKLAQEAVKAVTPTGGSSAKEASVLKVQSYATALFNPPPHANPKIAAKEGVKTRQFLLLGIKESAYGQYDTQKLKSELNKIARKQGLKQGKIRSVLHQK